MCSNGNDRRNWVRWVIQIIIGFCLAIGAVNCNGDDSSCWREMDAPVVYSNISTIWGNSSNDVFALVSDKVLHFDGEKWREVVFSGDGYGYSGVWGVPGRYFFVKASSHSDGGIIVEYDGSNWLETQIGVIGWFRDIWGSSTNDIFVVGCDEETIPETVISRILHFDGEKWTEMENEFSIALSSVWGSSSTDVFAVGSNTILHYDGNSWSVMEEKLPYGLSSVYGLSSTNVNVTGHSGILHYNGSSWTEVVNRGFGDLWISPENDVFAVSVDGSILFSEGGNWSSLCDVSYDIKENIFLYYFGVWGSSSDDVFVVGGKQKPQSGSKGMILRSNFKDDLNCLCK